MKLKLLFNYVPPALLAVPAAAFSLLKSYLETRDIGCKVYYWNLKLSKLQKEFLWTQDLNTLIDESNNLLLFFNYLSIQMSDKLTYNKIKGRLMSIKPQFVGRGEDLFDKHMSHYAEQLDKVIDEMIEEVCSPEITYYGFSANLYQWVCSSIIAAKIKARHPRCVIILGGIGTKSAAVKYIENFNQFDFALWGEGENSLYSLISELESDGKRFSDISNLVYRKGEDIIVSENRKVVFSDLSSLDVRPDYQDYFIQKKEEDSLTKLACAITIEGSRGCHWNKCHFCYLNTGYRNRSKEIDILIDELKYNLKQFHTYLFNFLDNDIINNDYQRFHELLDALIELKREYPEFKIGMAEIITKGIDAQIVKKMSLAGFERVQIGYESPSNNILRKIDKKNTFASNFLFIKFAVLYKVDIGGANVITGLLEETDEDIIEAIYNLHVLRFYLNYGQFNHLQTRLAVSRASRYYKEIDITSGYWERHRMFSQLLPYEYIKNDDKELDIIDVNYSKTNPIWDDFVNVEGYYLNNYFSYELISYESSVIYREYFNGTSINELEFELDSSDWYILKQANEKVISYEELIAGVRSDLDANFMDVEMINAIEDLKNEGLIYVSDDYSEIVSIVNTTILS